jgi:hypothetical protein
MNQMILLAYASIYDKVHRGYLRGKNSIDFPSMLFFYLNLLSNIWRLNGLVGSE